MHRLAPFLPRIQALCQHHRVRSLWVFGSVLGPDFNPDSDIDFLYELDHDSLDSVESNAHFFGFVEALQVLLAHPIDMVWMGGVQNPYFLESIDETKLLVYDQRDQKILV